MLHFDHTRRKERLPSSLQPMLDKARPELEEYLINISPERRTQTDPPYVWKRPFEPDVIGALHELSYGKCPFCERKFPPEDLLVYRFRPPSHASDGTSSPIPEAYLWVAFNWNNLFPICRDCRPLDRNFFPVEASRWSPKSDRLEAYLDSVELPIRTRESPRLCVPGQVPDDFHHFLGPDVRTELAEISGVSVPLMQTIDHFRLNRPDLVETRDKARMDRLDLLSSGVVLTDDERREGSETVEFATSVREIFLLVADHMELTGRKTHSLSEMAKRLERTKDQKRLSDAVEWTKELLFHSQDPNALESLRPRAQARSVPPMLRPDHARLTGISIRDYKSLENVDLALAAELSEVTQKKFQSPDHTILPEAPCLLILGENATGKSSILEAAVLACLSPAERAALDLNLRRLTLDPDYMGDLDSDPRGRATIDLTFADGTRRGLAIDRSSESYEVDEETPTRPLIFGYGAHRLYGGGAADTAARRVETLFYPDRSISNPEDWLTELNETDPSQISDVIMALRYLIEIDDDFENIVPQRDPSTGKTRWIINFVRTREGPPALDPADNMMKPTRVPYTVAQRFETVSSGYRAVLALVCDVLAGLHAAFPGSMYDARRAHAIVAVDEIEAHLHPRWKLTIIDRLRRALPNVTFLFTSHDPLCVRGTVPGEVVVLNRFVTSQSATDSNLPEMVESVAIEENAQTLTVEQMLNSDLFRLMTTEAESTRTEFAQVADILAKQSAPDAPLSEDETRTLAAFNAEITEALPYGDRAIPVLVQEAVAEYVSQTRRTSNDARQAARRKAIDALKGFLAGTVR